MNRRRLALGGAAALIVAWVVHSCSSGSPLGVAGNREFQQNSVVGHDPSDQDRGPVDQGPDADELLRRAYTVASQAPAVHLTGEQHFGDTVVELDLTVTNAGDAVGTLTRQGGPGVVIGKIWDVVRVDDTCYVKGIAGEPLTRYVQTCQIPLGDGQPGIDLTGLVDFRALIAPFAPGQAGDAAIDGNDTVNGVDAVKLTTAHDSTLYVQSSGTTYPLRAETRDGGKLNYDSWDKSVSVTPPEDVSAG